MTDTQTDNAPQNLPATETRAQAAQKRMDRFMEAVESRQEMMRTLLEGTGTSYSRFLEVFRRALLKTPDLLSCDVGSVVQACIDAATAGLRPDGRQGAIVIYRQNVAARGAPREYAKRAQFIAMYEGLLHIAYASGNFQSIMAHLVYEGDLWDYKLGIDPWIEHRPAARPRREDGAPEYKIIAAYAVAKTVNGGIFVEVFEPEDIRKVMAVSKAQGGPAKDWPEAMARKGPIRRMWKFLPRNDRMDRLLEVDQEADLDDYDEPAAPVRQLRTGFSSQPQLGQDATPTVPDMEVDQDAELEPVSTPTPGEDTENRSRPTEPPEDSFDAKLAAASGWLGVKQVLKTFRKTNEVESFDTAACVRCWERMEELRLEGKDKTDFISDPWLFECWLLGADPDADAVEGNWNIVQQDKAFTTLPEADRERITARVVAALEASDAQP